MNLEKDIKEKEEKAQFMALYWGQEVYQWNTGEIQCMTDKAMYNSDTGHLLLKDLKNISDKDAIEVAKIVQSKPVFQNETVGRGIVNNKYDLSMFECRQVYDFLRSVGYLVGWKSYSPEEIISKGWAKYRS